MLQPGALVVYSTLCLLLGLLNNPVTAAEAEGVDHSSTTTTLATTSCTASESTLISIVNASNDNQLESVVVNCLAYETNTSSISRSIVSHTSTVGNTAARSVVSCINNVLVVTRSSNSFSENITSCFECEDNEYLDMCPSNSECSSDCKYCYGGDETQCLVCDRVRYKGECFDVCPDNTSANADNECECPGSFNPPECTVCSLTAESCAGPYDGDIYLNETTCECTSCPSGFVFDLLDHEARVPDAVVGTPLGEECEHHEEKRSESTDEHGSSSSPLEGEILVCRRTCPRGYTASSATNNVCYAGNFEFCLEANDVASRCEKCRNGTLLNEEEHECFGFFEEICNRALELEEEVEHEEEGLKEYQEHLKISLPIVCAFVTFVFFGFALFAHFRYPHVGHQKRHRKPNKATELRKRTEFDKVLRPQSTVMFR